MAVVVFDVAETKSFTLKGDTENPTTWIIGRVGHRLWSHLQDAHSHLEVNDLGAEAKGSVKFDASKRADDFVRFGVKGWSNLLGKDGKEVPFATISTPTPAGPVQGITERLMEQIRPFIGELAGEVESFNSPKREEEKN